MSKVFGGWLKGSIYDPATGTVVQVNLISTEFSDFGKVPLPSETASGQTFGGYDSNLVIGFFDSDGLTQLRTWQEDGTKLNAVIYGADEFTLFYEDEEINFQRGVEPNAREGVTIHQVEMVSVGDTNQALFQFTNLIEAGSGAFTKFDDGADNEYNFIFPVSGASISAAADYANYASISSIIIQAKDYNGVSLGSASTTIDGNGRFSVTFELPANTYQILIFLDNSETFADNDITNHTIRVGEDTTYVTY